MEVDRGRLVGEWSTLVNPGRLIPHGIQTLTGITDDMVADAPPFEKISAALAQRLDGKILAAHNARFDYGFLRHEFRRAGVRYSAPVLCTVKLSRRLCPQQPRHNLDALIIRHALFCIDRHRGLGDARALWALAQIWRDEHGNDVLESTCADLLRLPAVPPGLAADALDDLPEAPGAYIFHGDAGEVLFVGRGANIRSRVLTHFCARGGRDVHITREVKRIEWRETTGELGAGLHEARLVHALAPRYNREAEIEEPPCSWHWRAETHALPPRLVTPHEVEFESAQDLYGPFRSRATARAALRAIAKAHGLCQSLLGLERGENNGPCAAHAVQHCRGACIDAESALSHAMRLVQALARVRMKPWPYGGRIAIREHDRTGTRSELHVFDRWRYLGTVRSDADLHELGWTRDAGEFSFDTYRLLVRYLKVPPRSCEVVRLQRQN